jgi:hypothetical protein
MEAVIFEKVAGTGGARFILNRPERRNAIIAHVV